MTEKGKEYGSLASYGDLHNQESTRTMADVQGVKILVLDVSDEEESRFGMVRWATAELPDGKKVKVRIGPQLIRDALKQVKDKGDFPVYATFTKQGNYWKVE